MSYSQECKENTSKLFKLYSDFDSKNKRFLNMSELDLNTLLKLIPDFDTDQNQQIYRFIRSCDSAFKLATPDQKTVLLVYALNRITGSGASDVHCRQYAEWNSLKTYLIQRFSNIKTISHLKLELQSMFQKPNETITQYYHRIDLCRSKIIEKLTTEITDDSLSGRKTCTEETALSVFINGLNSDIGTMLRTKQFTNLTDAGRFAMQEEKIRAMNNTRQSLYKLPIPKSHNPITNPNITRRTFVSQNPRPQMIRPQFQPQTSSQPKLCNYCKNPGHIISECRKRAYNNSMYPNKTFTPFVKREPHVANVNNLNQEAAMELGSSLETTASAHSTTNFQEQVETEELSLNSLQIDF